MFVYRQLSRMLLRPALWEDAFKSIIFSKYLYTWVYETYVTLCIIAGIINYNFDWIQYLPILIGHIGAIYTFCRQCLRQQYIFVYIVVFEFIYKSVFLIALGHVGVNAARFGHIWTFKNNVCGYWFNAKQIMFRISKPNLIHEQLLSAIMLLPFVAL